MKNVLLLFVAALVLASCHKTDSKPVYRYENVMWYCTADTNLTWFLDGTSVLEFLANDSFAKFSYTHLTNDTISVPYKDKNSKSVLNVKGDSMYFLNVTFNTPLTFYKKH